jgi:ubiquinone/menaquinone biosynthesis C-methylase UbiE
LSTQANYLPNVKDQYEDLPYPPRDPKDEKKRLIYTSLDKLAFINHYGFKGEQTFKNGFRCLVAGGGTGDATIHLAEQLKSIDGAEIIQVDLSEASLGVCKERAKVRGLNNIQWVQGSLLDVKKLGIGEFDYINCSGVLHHLENPSSGLNALKSVLKDDGIIGIMVYGAYGRLQVYPMQEALRYVNHYTESKQEKLSNTKKIISGLPANHFIHHNDLIKIEEKAFGDSGLYDVLLHSQDVAYTVPQLYDWVGEADLHILRLYDDERKNLCYKPKHYIRDAELAKHTEDLPEKEQQALAEILNGNLYKHIFYVGKKSPDAHIASIENENLVPFIPSDDKNAHLSIAQNMQSRIKERILVMDQKGLKTFLPATPESVEVMKCIDGVNTIAEIAEKSAEIIQQQGTKITPKDTKFIFSAMYTRMHETANMLLRAKGVGSLV